MSCSNSEENKSTDIEVQINSKIFGDGWNQITIDQLEKWKLLAKKNSTIHEKARQRWTKFKDMLILPVLICSATTTFLLAIDKFYDDSNSIQLLALFISSLGTIFNGIYNHYSPTDRANDHNNSNIEYQEVVSNIDYILHLPIEKRPDSEVTFKEITLKLDSINKNAPPGK